MSSAQGWLGSKALYQRLIKKAKWGSGAQINKKYSGKTVSSDIPTPRLFVVISSSRKSEKKATEFFLWVCVGCIFYSARSPRPAGESPASLALRRCSLPSGAVCFFSLTHSDSPRRASPKGSTTEINAASAEKGRGLIKICFTIAADHSRTKIITGAMSTDGWCDGAREVKKEMIIFECATPLNKCLSLSHANALRPIGYAKYVSGQQEADFIVDQIGDCIF